MPFGLDRVKPELRLSHQFPQRDWSVFRSPQKRQTQIDSSFEQVEG